MNERSRERICPKSMRTASNGNNSTDDGDKMERITKMNDSRIRSGCSSMLPPINIITDVVVEDESRHQARDRLIGMIRELDALNAKISSKQKIACGMLQNVRDENARYDMRGDDTIEYDRDEKEGEEEREEESKDAPSAVPSRAVLSPPLSPAIGELETKQRQESVMKVVVDTVQSERRYQRTSMSPILKSLDSLLVERKRQLVDVRVRRLCDVFSLFPINTGASADSRQKIRGIRFWDETSAKARGMSASQRERVRQHESAAFGHVVKLMMLIGDFLRIPFLHDVRYFSSSSSISEKTSVTFLSSTVGAVAPAGATRASRSRPGQEVGTTTTTGDSADRIATRQMYHTLVPDDSEGFRRAVHLLREATFHLCARALVTLGVSASQIDRHIPTERPRRVLSSLGALQRFCEKRSTSVTDDEDEESHEDRYVHKGRRRPGADEAGWDLCGL